MDTKRFSSRDAYKSILDRKDLSMAEKDTLIARLRDSVSSGGPDSEYTTDWEKWLRANAPTIPEQYTEKQKGVDVTKAFGLMDVANGAYSPTSENYWGNLSDRKIADAAIRAGALPEHMRDPITNDAVGADRFNQVRRERIGDFLSEVGAYETGLQRKVIADEFANSGADIIQTVTSPVETFNNFMKSPNKVDFVINSLGRTLAPTAYRLVEGALNGNENIDEGSIIEAVALDVGVNAATAPMGGAIGRNVFTYGAKAGLAPLRTMAGEFVGDAAAGAIGGGLQEVGAEALEGNGLDGANIARSTVLGAGGNAGTKVFSTGGRAALGATGIVLPRIKGTSNVINDASYSNEARLGSRLKELGAGVPEDYQYNTTTENIVKDYAARDKKINTFNALSQATGIDPKMAVNIKRNSLTESLNRNIARIDAEIDELKGRVDTERGYSQVESGKLLDKAEKAREDLIAKHLKENTRLAKLSRELPNEWEFETMGQDAQMDILRQLDSEGLLTDVESELVSMVDANMYKNMGATAFQSDATYENFANESRPAQRNKYTDMVYHAGSIQKNQSSPNVRTPADQYNTLGYSPAMKNNYGYQLGKEMGEDAVLLQNYANELRKENTWQILGLSRDAVNTVFGLAERASVDTSDPEKLKIHRWENGIVLPSEETEHAKWLLMRQAGSL